MTGSPVIVSQVIDKERSYVAISWVHLDDPSWQALWTAASSGDSHFQYLIYQDVGTYQFIEYTDVLDPCHYTEGQAFGSRGELHWKRDSWVDAQSCQHFGWQAVFVGEQSIAPAVPTSIPPIDLSGKGWYTRRVLIPLRGRRLSGQTAWFEPRIPHPLEYPWSGQEEILAMSVLEFAHNGQVEFVQLCGLEPWQSGGTK